MSIYEVFWSAKITADDPLAAAVEALRIQRDRNSAYTLFEVVDASGEALLIDPVIGLTKKKGDLYGEEIAQPAETAVP